MNAKPIGVFDSGVGGLSVLREIRSVLPAERLLYVADSGAAPYGDRPEAFIVDRSRRMVEFLLGEGAKAVVVACNTATAVAVRELRARFGTDIIAIEPAVKPAAAATKSGVIGVLATTQTLASDRFAQLLREHARGARVLLQACPGLVELVESGADDAQALAQVRRYVAPLVAQGADTLVLGCTHYPFLTPAIREAAGPAVSIVDPARAVAAELRRRLDAKGLLAAEAEPGKEHFWTSGAPAAVQAAIRRLWAAEMTVQALPAQFSDFPCSDNNIHKI